MPTIELKPCPFCGGKASFEKMEPSKDDPVEQMLFPGGTYRETCRNFGCWNKGPLPNNWYGSKAKAAEKWNRRAGDQPKPKQRRDRRKFIHFRFPTAEIAHVWCAKYGPRYDCLGASGCHDYAEPPVMEGNNREGGQP